MDGAASKLDLSAKLPALPGLRLQGISHAFGAKKALDDVSLAVEPGQLVCLLGPSGCGKTTLLRIAAGLEPLQKGSVALDGCAVAEPGYAVPPEQRGVGLVFQDYALFPHLDVAGNVAFGLSKLSASARAARVAETLAQVGMQDYARGWPHELSGGQQQRVALARAIAFRPDVLLLDEPLSNLDAKLRIDMRAEIRRIVDELRMTTIYVTHDRDEALSLADSIVVMRAGDVVQRGTPRELYERPNSRFIAGFLGETNLVEGTVEGAAGADRMAQVRTPIGTLRAHVPEALARSGTVTLSIRPEAMVLMRGDTHASTGADVIGATITSTTYLGAVAHHEVAVGGISLRVLETNPRVPARAGETVRLAVSPDQVVGVAGTP